MQISNLALCLSSFLAYHLVLASISNLEVRFCPSPITCTDNAFKVLLSYNLTNNDGLRSYSVTYNSSDLPPKELMEDEKLCTTKFEELNRTNETVAVQFSLELRNHGGRDCNCFEVEIFSNSLSGRYRVEKGNLCDNVPNETRKINGSFNFTNTTYSATNNMDDIKTPPFDGVCNTSDKNSSYINIEFSVLFYCNTSYDMDTMEDSMGDFAVVKDIEVAVQLSSMPDEWIPLLKLDNEDDSMIWSGSGSGEMNTNIVIIRNYKVDVIFFNMSSIDVSLQMCNFNVNDSFQFRWSHTSEMNFESNESNATTWALDNINITFISGGVSQILWNESFEESDLFFENQSSYPVMNGNIDCFCDESDNFSLVFNYDEDQLNMTSIDELSRTNTTVSYYLRSPWLNISEDTDDDDEEGRQTKILEMNLMKQIDEITENLDTGDQDTLEIAMNLREATNPEVLLSLNYNQTLLKRILDVGSEILQSSNLNNDLNAAVTVLVVVDELLFNYLPTNTTISRNNIGLIKRELDVSSKPPNSVVIIDSYDVQRERGDHITVELPVELLEKYTSDEEDMTFINVTAAFFRNISALFVEAFATRNQSNIASDVVAVSLQCGDTSCPTNNITLSSNVTIKFEHSQSLKEELARNNYSTSCVFLNISSSMWISKGCSKDVKLSSPSITVCQCNHLTHFAILLSANPPRLSKNELLSLSIISYVGVGISLIAMTITVFIFIILKPLRNMRNYIHIHLCINLAIAQVIFVAGIDRTNEFSVPIHCQVIAVLLHYFFLVAFMWMLMEGVVLYVALIRVFVLHKKRYMVAYTVTSYGLPLIYLGLICLPLGFYDTPHYGHDIACFLKYETHFIWAFIAPVIVIFVANICFLVMASVIMWRHQMKHIDQSKTKNISSWLRGIISLVVIMGLTWIMGLLVLDVTALIPLTYIYTIMVAFQGLFIFFIFVVLSKATRDTIWKAWRDFLNKHYGTSHVKSSTEKNGHFTKSTKVLSESNQIERSSDRYHALKKSESTHTRFSVDTQRTFLSLEVQPMGSEDRQSPSAEHELEEEWPEFRLPGTDSNTGVTESSASFPIN